MLNHKAQKVGQITESADRIIRWFFIVLVVTLIIKCVFAIYVPLTGDEAYFAVWGKHFGSDFSVITV